MTCAHREILNQTGPPIGQGDFRPVVVVTETIPTVSRTTVERRTSEKSRVCRHRDPTNLDL